MYVIYILSNHLVSDADSSNIRTVISDGYPPNKKNNTVVNNLHEQGDQTRWVGNTTKNAIMTEKHKVSLYVPYQNTKRP